MTKPAEHTQDELDALRKSDRVYFLTLFHQMLVAHYRAGNDLLGVIKHTSDTIDTIEAREKAA